MDAEQFGQYRLEQMIGRGGMGEVYRAYDTVRSRIVALKRLPAHLATDEEFKARFRKESELASRLFEPHIIPIHDFGEIDGRLYIDMRLVEGRDLATVIKEDGPLAPGRAVAVVSQVASALDAAHADGLVHRDVKPSNVLLTGDAGDEFAYLVDFGIARSVGAGEPSLTVTGATVGTLDYMAPERFLGSGSDHRVDVYSLACMLFEVLTGRKPFRSDGPPAMMHAHLNMEPPRPSRERPTVPVALDQVVATGMAKRPDDRYPTAKALADAARAALRNGPPTRVLDRPAPAPPVPSAQVHPGDPARRPDQKAPPWPVGRTLVGMPDAGFSLPSNPRTPNMPGGPPIHGGPHIPHVPGRPGGPGTAPARRGLVVAAVVGIVAVVAIGIAVGAQSVGGRGTGIPGASSQTTTTPLPTTTPATTTPATTTDGASPSTTTPAFVRPVSLPDGDVADDEALWGELQGTGVIWSGCKYAQSAIETTQSYLLCEASSPALDLRLGFESYSTAEEVRLEVDGYTRTLTGAPGTCDAGGKFSGKLLGRDVACGYFTFDDGTTAYYIVWTEPDMTVLVTAADGDPARTWQWFLAHDPL